MEERKIYQVLKKYRDENQKALKEMGAAISKMEVHLAATVSHFNEAISKMEVHLAATVSHFNKAIGKMEAANEEFASEISEHIVDLDVRLLSSYALPGLA